MTKIWMVAVLASFFATAAVAEQNTTLEFENVWVRAMPPFQPNSAGYFTVTNRGDVAVAIVGATSNVSDSVELHTTRKVDGLLRMEKLEGLVIAPGERVELAPGGKHLMLLGLAFRLVPGDDVALCLQLVTEDEVCTDAEVRMTADASDSKEHQHHH